MMTPKTHNVNGINICYFEDNVTQNNILFFLHGNSCASNIWNQQFESSVFKNYHIIAVDLPGHGESDSYTDYGPIEMGKLLASVIKQLTANKEYLLIGFSYGTNLICEALAHGLKPVGIAFSGACIVGVNYNPLKILLNVSSNIYLQEEVNNNALIDFFNEHLAFVNQHERQMHIINFTNTKKGVRESIVESAATGNYTDEFLTLSNLSIPLLFCFGKLDRLVDINYLDSCSLVLWNDKIYKLDNAGHFVQAEQPKVFNQLLSSYASERFRSNHSAMQNE